ncbi:PEP-CTERM sorting domain-containing protein [candidate division KSB1 bacterium]|nr:PEP-CTERM sorting domain-containing protein [candidate division KSB1 bacterium]
MKQALIIMTIGLMLSFSSQAFSTPTTFVTSGDYWQYQTLSFDLRPIWNSVTYTTFNWNNNNWQDGQAAFGNPYSAGFPYNTYWQAGTDLALKTEFEITGNLNSVILNVASDNGFIVFINGVQVAKEWADGYTSYWEYTKTPSTTPFQFGLNTISVFAEDNGGATFFDLQLGGDVSPIPEPASVALMGIGFISMGLLGYYRRKK